MTAVVMLRISLVCVFLSSFQGQDARPDKQPADPISQLAAKYLIQIVSENEPFPVKTTGGAINGRLATPAELEAYVPLFLFEFNLYPPTLVKNAKLKRIVLCKELSYDGQIRNAVPDLLHDTLYLEVVRGMGHNSYMRKVIHHEFFHMIDFRDDGLLYKDDAWSALNPAGFSYGTGGRNAQNDATVSLLNDAVPGFLN